MHSHVESGEIYTFFEFVCNFSSGMWLTHALGVLKQSKNLNEKWDAEKTEWTFSSVSRRIFWKALL